MTRHDRERAERAWALQRSNLPAQRQALIGRDAEAAKLRQRLMDAETGLHTLTGTGGCGKTSLAIHVARGLLDAFADGVWLVELAPLSDPALVEHAIATVLGVREAAGRSLREEVIAFLRPRALLLILDNCEHLIEACAQVVDGLLAGCPDVRILATSRELLRISGEVAWSVPPLATPDPQHLPAPHLLVDFPAVRLFVHRAQSVRPDFALGPDNAAEVAQVCARLEGLPLALELAAARTRAMSVGQIAARLDISFRLLVGGSRTAPSRQQTLEATLDWSHDLLTTPERTLFRRLSVFAGGFDLDAAESVCADEMLERGDILDVLTRLVDRSLVVVEQQSGEARYRLLEPIRQYVLERLRESGELEGVRARHALHYRALAERIEWELWGPHQAPCLERLERDQDNLRAGLTWYDERPEEVEAFRVFVVALSRFWHTRGKLSEGLSWLHRALHKPVERVTRGWVTVLIWTSSLAHHHGDLDEAVALGEQAVAASRQLGDPLFVGSALMTLGDDLIGPAEDLERAISLAVEAVEVLRSTGERGRRALSVAVAILGGVTRLQGDDERATVVLEEAVEVTRDVGNTWAVAMSLQDLAQVALEQGKTERAAALFTDCLALARELADSRRVAECLEGFGEIAAETGRAERAARLLAAAQSVRDANGSSIEPVDRAMHARSLTAARQRLGETAFKAAWDAGAGTSLEHSIEAALAHEGLTSTAAEPSSGPNEAALLSAREWDVVELIARGLTNPQIAEELVISRRTADRHVSNILDKLGFATRGQIAAWTFQHRASARE
jgi:predicted ATPase/DNA-binding NarL/FixJ family response regulator